MALHDSGGNHTLVFLSGCTVRGEERRRLRGKERRRRGKEGVLNFDLIKQFYEKLANHTF